MKAYVLMENGERFYGRAFGHIDFSVGEVVFNTGMTGYQEIFSDPSYYGQMVVMTYPLIGNYGISGDDFESSGLKVRGIIVGEICSHSDESSAIKSLEDNMKENGIVGIEGIDTRRLTKLIRNSGVMKGAIVIEGMDEAVALEAMAGYCNDDAVYKVSSSEVVHIPGRGLRVALMDYGAKGNIVSHLTKRACDVTIYPANTRAEVILGSDAELVFLSNGPGDPAKLSAITAEVSTLIKAMPVAGICLGHQLIALALGGETSRLKFGHRGCNHPVKDMRTGKIYITSQNHGYHVSSVPSQMAVTHISLNDQSVEGLRHLRLPVFSVQFHPEASPGPMESAILFDEFLALAQKAVRYA